MSFKAEVKTVNDSKWYDNALRFATSTEADSYGSNLMDRWTAVEEYRVTEVPDAVNYVWDEVRYRAEPLKFVGVTDPQNLEVSSVARTSAAPREL